MPGTRIKLNGTDHTDHQAEAKMTGDLMAKQKQLSTAKLKVEQLITEASEVGIAFLAVLMRCLE